MKKFLPASEPVEVVAQFGDAQLVNALGGRLELRGGTKADRQRAGQWIKLYFPDAMHVLLEEP